MPFTLYRFLMGDYIVAAVELSLVLGIVVIFYYVWKTHRVNVAAILLCILMLGVVTTVVHLKGPVIIYWLYPVMLGCFCILHARTAAMLCLISMLLLFPALYPKLGTLEVVIIYISLGLLSLFSYTFTIITYQHQVELSRLATKDGLTGAGNRRSLDEALELIRNKHQREPIIASLIMLDLDHFKSINDTFGHNVGDQVLIKVANLLRSIVRVSDQLYRYGGEEFVLITEGADLKEAAILAETIRSRVEKSQLFEKQRITVSLGVAELSQVTSEHSWLKLADEALYKAKNEGRNRYCVAEVKPLNKTI